MSLERKIIISFLISATIVAFLAGAAAFTSVQIRREIASLELSDTLRSKALLLRRAEKNWFLYGEARGPAEVHGHLDDLAATLRGLGPRAREARLAALGSLLAEYREGFSRIEALAAGFRARLRLLLPSHPGLLPYVPLLEAALLERPLVTSKLLGRLLPGGGARELLGTLEALDAEITGLRRSGEDLLTVSADLDRVAREGVDHALLRSRNAAVVLFPLALLVGFGSLFTVGRNVVSRLQLLTRVIEQTGKGDFSVPSLPAGDDEIGRLVAAVATMEAELADRDRQIATKNEELLQGRKLAAIGTLASGVAHELNNPLNNISLAAQILARSVPAAQLPQISRESLEDILAQTQRVKLIVGDLLEFSREKPPDLHPTDLVALVREAAARAVPPGDDVTFALAGAPGATVLADGHLLAQVFVNLIANAVDAMGGRGRITAAVESAAGTVRVAITDTGRGIHPDDLPKVFDPFFTTKDRGTGLGLAIVYNTIRKHGGTIEVASRVEEGTTFTVTLPAGTEQTP